MVDTAKKNGSAVGGGAVNAAVEGWKRQEAGANHGN